LHHSPHTAIICESYLVVAAEIHKSEAHQEITTDIFSLLVVTFKSFAWFWPGHQRLIKKLKSLKERRVSFIELRALFPGSIKFSTPTQYGMPYRGDSQDREECIEPGMCA
jgi:hypothetical protein